MSKEVQQPESLQFPTAEESRAVSQTPVEECLTPEEQNIYTQCKVFVCELIQTKSRQGEMVASFDSDTIYNALASSALVSSGTDGKKKDFQVLVMPYVALESFLNKKGYRVVISEIRFKKGIRQIDKDTTVFIYWDGSKEKEM